LSLYLASSIGILELDNEHRTTKAGKSEIADKPEYPPDDYCQSMNGRLNLESTLNALRIGAQLGIADVIVK